MTLDYTASSSNKSNLGEKLGVEDHRNDLDLRSILAMLQLDDDSPATTAASNPSSATAPSSSEKPRPATLPGISSTRQRGSGSD
jgi:hypothetical protein